MIRKLASNETKSKNGNFHLWIKVVVFNFLIIAVIGALLRLAFVVELPLFNYRNVLHAHSHVALLGWLFCGLLILIVHAYNLSIANYRFLFWGFQVCVLGMLVSFPLQGYGLFSIVFSSLHILLSYVLVYRITSDKLALSDPLRSKRWLYGALFFLVLASFGTWALGPLMTSAYKGSSWFYSAIQFFLHFQFNGWFIFAIIALFLKTISKSEDIQHNKHLNTSFYLFIVSCFLTFALAVTWSNPDRFLFWVNSLGVILQLAAWIYFARWIKTNVSAIKLVLNKQTRWLWLISFTCLSIKILIQTMVAIPSIAVISYTIHNFVIGFIHLLMLGCLSLFILGYLAQVKMWTQHHQQRKRGVWIFIVGVGLTELLLFIQGMLLWLSFGFIPGYYIVLLLFSLLLPLGVLLYWLSILRE